MPVLPGTPLEPPPVGAVNHQTVDTVGAVSHETFLLPPLPPEGACAAFYMFSHELKDANPDISEQHILTAWLQTPIPVIKARRPPAVSRLRLVAAGGGGIHGDYSSGICLAPKKDPCLGQKRNLLKYGSDKHI